MSDDYGELYDAAGEANKLDPDLLRAMGHVESGNDRFAVSPAGAEGVMQIMPDTQREVDVKNPFVPEQSIHGGGRYLRRMVDQSNNIYTAIGKYNAGPNGDLSNPETVDYVRKVADKWDEYRVARMNKRRGAPADDWVTPPADDWVTPGGKAQPRAADTSYGDLPTAQQDRAAPAPESAPGQSAVGADWNALRRGVVTGTAGAISGAGEVYRRVTGGDPNTPNAAITAGQNLKQRAERSYPIDPSNAGLATEVAGGLGSMIPMVGASAAAGAAAPVAGALAGAAVVGAQVYSDTREAALAKGAPPATADQAATESALANMGLLALPVGRVLHAMPHLMPGLLQTLEGMAKRGVEFAGFNSVATVADNYVAQHTYDPSRGLMDGVEQSALVGAATGPIFHLPQAARTAHEALTRPPASPGLAANVGAQQQAAAGAQAPPGAPPPPVAPPPVPPVPPAPPVAPPPVAPPAPHAPPDPHQVLSNIAQGIDPATPAPAPPAPAPTPTPRPEPPPTASPPEPAPLVESKPPPAPTVEAKPPPTEHPGLVIKSLETGKETHVQPPGTVPPAAPEPAPEPTPPPAKAPETGRPTPRPYFMNEGEIDHAIQRFADHPVLGRAARWLGAYRDAVNQNSDGWPYWGHTPAGRLMGLINQAMHPREAEAIVPTEAEIRSAMSPIKAFATKHGLKVPDLEPTPAAREPAPAAPKLPPMTAQSRQRFEASNAARVAAGQPPETFPEYFERITGSKYDNAPSPESTPPPADVAPPVLENPPDTQAPEAPPAAPKPKALNDPTIKVGDTVAGTRIDFTGQTRTFPPTRVAAEIIQDDGRHNGWVLEDGEVINATKGPNAPAPLVESKPAAPTEQVRPEQTERTERPAGYGAANTVFTADAAQRARERLRAKLGSTLNAGFDPELMLDGLTLAGYHVEAGARSFIAYSKAMLDDLGEAVRPYLAQFYTAVRMHPGFDTTGMDDHAAVEAAHRAAQETGNEQAARPPDGRVGEPGDGEAGESGLAGGEPAGGRPAEPLETPPSADGQGLAGAGAGDAGEAGVRPGREEVGEPPGIHPGGDERGGRGDGSDQGVAPDGAGERAEHQPQPAPARPNFHIDDPDRLIAGTPKVRFARNRAALEALSAIEAEQRAPTQAELEAMAGYIGWGSFGQDLFQGTFERPARRPGWDEEAQWLRDHLGKEQWESAQRSIINAHYTDPVTVKSMWDMVQHMGFRGGRILEPSMGIGNFFGLMPREVMGKSTLTGIELDRVTGAMAKLLYPDAGIHIKGFEESAAPDNHYDLVIGNWPFAAQSPADRRYDRLSPTLHDYFFLKALDQTRPGGLVVGVTSSGTMDKAGRATRMELAKKGELIASFRLPSGAFDKYAGTSVVTDIIVLRKRATAPENPSQEPWVTSQDMRTRSGPSIRVNQYYHANPDNVLGTLDFGHGTTRGSAGMIVHRPEEAAFMQALTGLAQRLPADAYQPVIRGNEPRFLVNNTADRQNSIVIGPDKKLYQVAGERLARLDDVRKEMATGSAKAQKDRREQIEKLVGMRKAYGTLIDAERDGDPKAEQIRQQLAKQFADFRAAHGPIGTSEGLRIFDRAKDPGGPMLAALERKDGTPSAILTEPTVRSKRSMENPSIADAYVLARNEQASFDMDRVAALAKVDRAQAEQHLLDSGAVLRIPGGGFEPADSYLSGNVRKKLAEAQQALANGEPMQASVDRLTEAIPPTVPYYSIEAKLGAPWVGDDAYKAFVGDLLGLDQADRKDVKVRFAGSRWKVDLPDYMLAKPEAHTLWGHERVGFDKFLQQVMGNQTIRIMDPRDRDGGPYYNAAASEEANAKAAVLREKFTDWAWADPQRKLAFERAYNETMNAIAKPQFDGSFMDMSGMALKRGDDPFSLRRHQVNAIWRGVIQGRGLFAHEVGTGKTYTMGGIAVEGRRYGVFRKPLVFAHNANSAAVAREMQQMYPGGKFLYIDNLAPDVIKTELHRIANEDWDAVVMPHSLIDRMSLKRETLMELAADQIAELETEAIEAAHADGIHLTPEMMGDAEAMRRVRSPTAKDLVKQRQAIIASIEKNANRSSREGAVAFEDLGIDAIMVDEAHEFKKPPIATRMRLKGLNTQTSNRSINLDFLTGYVKKVNSGKGVYLFTGTPITNALNEIYHQSRFFMGDRLEQAGVKSWDAWFNTFATAMTDPELTAAGTFEQVTRLASFVNTDELVRMMSEFTDVVQAKDMPEFTPRATADGKTLKSPDLSAKDRDFLENGRAANPEGRPYKKIINDIADPSPAQREALADIQERVTEFKNATGREKREMMLSGDRRSPIITDQDGPKAGLDARMFNPDAPDHRDSKVNRVVRNVLKHYQEPGAGQAVFVDMGYSAGVSQKGRENPFVLVNDMVAKLVKGGIPRSEIAIVAGGVDAEKKKAIADEMNAGTKRVVIGQSGTLGVGVNMQKQLRAMHHMDAPWRPGDLEQRNGRGERQGNEWNTVLEYRYITEAIDGRRWQVLTAKDRFIKQFIAAFNDTSGKRLGALEGDAADIGEEEDMSKSLSAAAGDPRIMLRAKYRGDVERIERRERMHTVGQADALDAIQRAHEAMARDRREAEAFSEDADTWAAASQRAAARAAEAGDTKRWYEATVGGEPATTGEEIQRGLDRGVEALVRPAPGQPATETTLATINGFNIVSFWPPGNPSPLYLIENQAGRRIGQTDAPTMPRIIPRMNDLRGASQAAQFRHDERAKSIAALEKAGQQEFPQKEQLLRRRQQLAALEDDMAANPTPPPSWLRFGAPMDSTIYVDGKPHEVRGHRQSDDYYLSTDEGDISYRRARDESGQPLFDVHPPPEQAAAVEVPAWAKAHAEGVPQGRVAWHDGDLAVVRGLQDGEPAYLGFKLNAPPDQQGWNIFGMRPKDVQPGDQSRMMAGVKEAETRETNRRKIVQGIHAGSPALAEADDFNRGDDSQYARRKPGKAQAEAPAAELPDEVKDARAKLAGAATDMMRYMGLPESVGLKLVDRIATASADASYKKNLITFALDTSAAHAPYKIWHEGMHALLDPDLGLLSPKERLALYAGADRWLKASPKRAADLQAIGYKGAELRDEAVARMAEATLASGLHPRSLIGGIVEKLQNVGRALGQVLRGQGWTTAEDVLNGLMQGKRASPQARAALASPGGPRQPAAPADEDALARRRDEAFPPEGEQKSVADVLGEQGAERFARRRPEGAMETAKLAVDDIERLFSPTTRSTGARDQELLIRGRSALKAQSAARTTHALERFRHVVGRLSQVEQAEITDRMERGQAQRSPQLQAVADALRGQLDLWTRKIQSLGTGKLEDANEFYMGRIYKNYDEVFGAGAGANNQGMGQAIGAGLAKKPLQGSGNFLKRRVFEYQSDAVAQGLEPVTWNPIEMQTLKLREMQQYYHGAKMAEEMKATGLARWVTTEGYRLAEQLGMKPLDDRIFAPKIPLQAPGHGMLEHGKWYGPGMAADVFNNFISEGIAGNFVPYDMMRKSNNALNQLQLGLSGFHATFIALDTMTSRVALGLQQIARGDIGRGIVNAALGFSPHNVARSIARGSKLRAAYLDPQGATPEYQKLAALLNQGGGRINMDQFYRSSDAGPFFKTMHDLANPDGAFREAWQMAKDTPLTAPLRIAGRVLETITEPLMGQMVPRAKLGVFADLAADWQRRNPNASPADQAKAMTKMWDSVDNRMGQLVYDNLFWNKTLKDTAFLMTRSVGWNLGTMRELGGGGVDTVRAAANLARLRSPEFTTRMAYGMAMPVVTALYGALLTYAYTGKGPQEMLDYFYPPDGKGGRNGVPGYIKDVVAYAHAPVQTLLNKQSPLLSTATQLYQNRDYYGGIINDPVRDNPAEAYVNYMLNQALPFSVRAMMKNSAGPTPPSAMEQMLAFWGVQPAPASIVNPERSARGEARADKSAFRRRQKEQGRLDVFGQ